MKWRQLKHYCDGPPQYGLNTGADAYTSEGVRLLRTTDIGDDGSLTPETDGVFVPPSLVDSRYRVKPGDLLFSRAGSLGRCLRIPDSATDLTFAGYLVRFRPIAEADSRYLEYCASSTFFQSGIEADAVTSTISNFNAERYSNLRLPDLSFGRQRAIADFLDTETTRIDALITKKRRMIDLLDEWFVAQRSWLVLRGLDPVHGDSAIATAAPWDVAALGVLIMLHRGFDLPTDARLSGSVPVVSSGGISGTHSTGMCDPPGVITGRYGTIGEVFFLTERHWPLNTTLFVSDFRDNAPRWVFHLLSALPLDFDAEKSAVTGINRNVVGALRAPRPPVAEQREIAMSVDRCLDRRDRVVEPLTRQIELLVEHRQALITAAVTGELVVPGVAA